MLGMNDLKPGTVIMFGDQPHQVLETHHIKMARGKPTTQTKLKNLISGNIINETFQQSDKIEPAEVERVETVFKYRTKDEFFFAASSGQKFSFSEQDLAEKINYLMPGLAVKILVFNEEPFSVELPVKVVLKVVEAPPGDRGNTAQGGTKDVLVETGGKIRTPLFVKSGDTIEVNTETGQYVRRM